MKDDAFKLIRPTFPESSPLSFEVDDEGYDRPACRISCGFTPKWFQRRMALDYSKKWHSDAEYRWQSHMEMKRLINHVFPRLNLGGPSPEEITGSISTAYGSTLVPAVLMSSGVKYFEDNQPADINEKLTDEQAEQFEVPDLDRSAVFCNLMEQMDYIEQRWSRIEGVINFQGVLNNAFRVRGQKLFEDMVLAPARAHHVLQVCTDTMLKIIKAVYARQQASGVDRDYFVTANCIVNMISGAHYQEFVMPYDKQLSEEFTHFGIHNCAWSIDNYMDSYAKIRKLSYIDFGIDSTLSRVKELFPDTCRSLMYPPVGLKDNTSEKIRNDLKRVHDELSPCEIVIGAIQADTPDERVMEFYELAAEIWQTKPEELAPDKPAL